VNRSKGGKTKAKILILGGGFGGVVAAEALAKQLGDNHQITLMSRSRRFLFYPALVPLAFGKCEPDDVSFDICASMLDRRVGFIQAEAAHIDLGAKKVVVARGEVSGSLSYDYLIIALGRRLATERVTGFFENADHLLTLAGALKFGKAIRKFDGGRAVIGQCAGARLPVPIYETAFALSRFLKASGDRDNTKISIVSPDASDFDFVDTSLSRALDAALARHDIEHVPNFSITTIAPGFVTSADGHEVDFKLLMLLPPFAGPGAVARIGITNDEGFINVDWTMKVPGVERIYAVGDCVNFEGPKLAHMAVHQAEVAAANLAAEIAGHAPVSHYQHDLKMVIDEGGDQSVYFHKELWLDEPSTLSQGRFWRWAKHLHEKYWEAVHA
jgi:sulfide:quinone oxidoreductase